MLSKYPPSGDFSDLNLHEMLCQLIIDRFSGSLEIKSKDAVRNFLFDKGLLCTATSDASDEQLDGMLELEIRPSLEAEQLAEINRRRKKGQTFGKALVDCGFIPAMEFLEYSKRMAEIIFKRALAGIAQSYNMKQGKSLKYRPLPIDPLMAIFQSISGHFSPKQAKEKLGGDNIVYSSTAKYDNSFSTLKDISEIKQIINQLDGKRSVKEIIDELNSDPEHCAGILLFMKWLKWIEPARADVVADLNETPLAIEQTETSLPIADVMDHQPVQADALNLLEQELKNAGDIDDSSNEFLPSNTIETIRATEELFDKYADDQVVIDHSIHNEIQSRNTSRSDIPSSFSPMNSRQSSKVRFLKPALGIFAIVLIVVTTLFTFSIISKPKDQSSIVEAMPSAEKKGQQLQADSTPTDSGKPDKVAVSNKNVESVIAKKTDNSIDKNTNAWNEIQPQALRSCMTGNWTKAARIWEEQVQSKAASSYTVLISMATKDIYLEPIFERFANSAKLRQDFFILTRQKGNELLFSACWNVFPDLTSAQSAIKSLPERIRRLYNPTARSVAELHGN